MFCSMASKTFSKSGEVDGERKQALGKPCSCPVRRGRRRIATVRTDEILQNMEEQLNYMTAIFLDRMDLIEFERDRFENCLKFGLEPDHVKIEQDLPDGFSHDPATGIIPGIFTAKAPMNLYKITAAANVEPYCVIGSANFKIEQDLPLWDLISSNFLFGGAFNCVSHYVCRSPKLVWICKFILLIGQSADF